MDRRRPPDLANTDNVSRDSPWMGHDPTGSRPTGRSLDTSNGAGKRVAKKKKMKKKKGRRRTFGRVDGDAGTVEGLFGEPVLVSDYSSYAERYHKYYECSHYQGFLMFRSMMPYSFTYTGTTITVFEQDF